MTVSKSFVQLTVQPKSEANSFFIGNQYGPQIVMLDDGGLALSYGSAFGVLPLLNKFDPQYVRQGSHLLPHVTTPADLQSAPAIAKLADGRLAVVWVEGPAATNATRGVIVDPQSFAIDVAEFGVFGFAGSGEPSLAALSNGNWVAVRSNDTNADVNIQVMTPAGFGVGVTKIIESNVSQSHPQVAALAGGEFVVVYEKFVPGVISRVFATVYDNSGNIVQPEFQISRNVGEGLQPAVTALRNGDFAVVYQDTFWPDHAISLEIRDPQGNVVFAPVEIPTHSLRPSDLDLVELDNGMFAVSWTEVDASSATVLESFRYGVWDRFGKPQIADVLDLDSLRASQGSIEALGAGRVAFAWRDLPDSGGNDGISLEVRELVRESFSDAESDEIVGDALRDRMEGNGGNDRLFGMGAFDLLIGGDGDDTLDGGTNPEIGQAYAQGDIMLGGAGNDTYFVDSPLDLVDEGFVFPGFGFGGIDTIFTTSDFYWDTQSVGENVLVEPTVNDIGGDGVTVVGGIFNNTLLGHAGTDIFFGRGGSDVYRGGDGVDWYSLSTLGLTDANAYAGVNGFNTVIVQERKSGPLSYDIVFEFEPGRDKIDLTDYSFLDGIIDGAEYIARAINDGLGNSYIALGDGLDYLYMVGLEKAELRAGDFIV